MSIRYGNENCQHSFVKRLDGYEEQCEALICKKCGAYACACDVRYSETGYGYNSDSTEGLLSDFIIQGSKIKESFIL